MDLGEGGPSVGGSVSYEVPAPFKSGWSESSSMKRAREFFGSRAGSLSMSHAECNFKEVRLSSINVPQFSTNFKRALQHLNSLNRASCDRQQAAFRSFVRDYGTHFFQNMVFGAKVAMMMQYSESASSMVSASNIYCNIHAKLDKYICG